MARWGAGHIEEATPLGSWVPAGWYPDPLGVGAARYWDGSGWSRNYRDAPPPEPVPSGPGDPTIVTPAIPRAAVSQVTLSPRTGEEATQPLGSSGPLQISRNRAAIIGAGVLLLGFLVGAVAGSGGNGSTKTVTQAQAAVTEVASTPTHTVTQVQVHTRTVVHTVTHTVTQPAPAATSPPEGSGGEEGEEDEVGSSSHAGDAKFCEEHECIGEFESEPGTVVECSDGSYSHSGGISGACSDHGGEA
jgi:hypothetical protein